MDETKWLFSLPTEDHLLLNYLSQLFEPSNVSATRKKMNAKPATDEKVWRMQMASSYLDKTLSHDAVKKILFQGQRSLPSGAVNEFISKVDRIMKCAKFQPLYESDPLNLVCARENPDVIINDIFEFAINSFGTALKNGAFYTAYCGCLERYAPRFVQSCIDNPNAHLVLNVLFRKFVMHVEDIEGLDIRPKEIDKSRGTLSQPSNVCVLRVQEILDKVVSVVFGANHSDIFEAAEIQRNIVQLQESLQALVVIYENLLAEKKRGN